MDSKDKDRRTTDLQNLIQSVYKGAPEQTVEELLRHSMRILNSFLGSSSNDDISVVKQKSLEKVRW